MKYMVREKEFKLFEEAIENYARAYGPLTREGIRVSMKRIQHDQDFDVSDEDFEEIAKKIEKSVGFRI